jgi:hypothetical protein
MPAGADKDGKTLTVVELGYAPASEAARSSRCAPDKRYVLVQTGAPPRTIVTQCQDDPEDTHPFETTVTVKKNLISVDRNGGAFAGFVTQDYQLSPWLPLSANFCEVDGDGEWRAEDWDWRKMRGVYYDRKTRESDDEAICGLIPAAIGNLIVPTVAMDAGALEKAGAGLGSCAMTLDASGQNGFVTYGKADAKDQLRIKLLLTGKRTLLAQVIDPTRSTAPAKSWIYSDHSEIWQGVTEPVQFGIPVDEGPTQIGHGKPKHQPSVHRWKARLPDGSFSTVLRIELAPPDSTFDTGFTFIYSQGLEGRAQKRLISTNKARTGSGADTQAAMAVGAAGTHVTCSVINGLLEVTGARLPLIELRRGALGREP